ncbi:acylphosphatase [Hansschlegelia sp. KR7-227]|jgi:acylphosphatase|uniref:acylphosphatase n=1 Tax=Hansschlegelia sp. KR7-227 TaxID=3400914 RepID=UPI003C104639
MADRIERIAIAGRVQGVFYRKWAQSTATSLGLRGWVRNLSDGGVEALVGGPKERIDAFAEACRAGPPHAEVTSVERSIADPADLPEVQGVEIADDG